jgi:hypothetical protein
VASGGVTSPALSPAVADVRELAAVDLHRAMLVIPCSGVKARGGRPRTRTIVAPSWPETLSFARTGLWARSYVNERHVMPAWQRYKGHFYQQAGEALGEAVAAGVRIIILSGGYGLLRADEPIGTYNKVLKRSDWPPDLLESLLTDEAVRVGAEAVVAFTAATTDYAKLVRGAPWRQCGIVPVLFVTITDVGGGAMVKVPRQLGQAFTALWKRDLARFPMGLTVERLA